MSNNKDTTVKALSVRSITSMALLIALQVVFTRFLSITQWNMRIGFGFVPLVVAAVIFGPVRAAFVGGMSDFIGSMLIPTATGPYNPGITLTNALMGLVFGLFLKKKLTTFRIIPAVAVNQLVLSLLLNTYWISISRGSPFLGTLFPNRLIQCIINVPVQIVVISLIAKSAGAFLKKQADQLN